LQTGKVVDSLVIEDYQWPAQDLNQLYSVFEAPWPNWLTYTVYQPLVAVNETAQYQQGVIQYLPGLASSWNVSSDGKTYTFNLRQNVKFSDGNPLNAYQVWTEMYGLYYLSGNSSAWLESYNFFDMTPVKFGSSTIAMINGSGVVNPSAEVVKLMSNSSWPIYVAGPYQIVFRLASPFQWFPGTLVVMDGMIFDSQWLLNHGGFGTPSQFNVYFNQHPIPGTGPYIVTQVVEQSYVKFTQNPSYWGSSLSARDIASNPILDPGHAKTVTIYSKSDDVARYTDLSNGFAQITAIQASDWPLVISNPQYQYLKLPPWAGEISMLVFNMHSYPTNVTAVRQAIVHSINYTDLYNKAYLGQIIHDIIRRERLDRWRWKSESRGRLLGTV